MKWRDDIPLRNEDHIHFILNHAAMGDTITSLPAVRWAIKHNAPDLTYTLWVPDFYIPLMEVLMGDLQPQLEFQPLHEFKAEAGGNRKPGPGVMNAAPKNTMTRNRIDLVDFGYMTLIDRMPDNDKERSYPTGPISDDVLLKYNLPKQYVCIGSGATSRNKMFHHTVMEPLLKAMIAKGYTPVILGKSSTIVKAVNEDKPLEMIHDYENVSQAVRDKCINLRDKTPLVDTRNILAHSAGMFGVDGGLLHLAGTTDCPIIYGITSVSPRHRSIVRHGKRNYRTRFVCPDIACQGCQSNWTLMFRHDFRFCAYDDYACVTKLNPWDMVDAFDDLYYEVHTQQGR